MNNLLNTAGLTPEEIQHLAQAQRARREQVQARIAEAQRAKEEAEAESRRAMLVEYHLYRAAALSQGPVKPDRFEEAYLRWQVGLTTSSLHLDPTMFDTEKVYRLVRFLAVRGQLNNVQFDAQRLRMEFPNWVDDLSQIPTDGSIRSALKSLALRPTGITEAADNDGHFMYDAAGDKQPRFRRKSGEGDTDAA
ncbi:MAG: hypothetical protein QNJ98_16575 [Planctomycetota bacterium]|nr:hypothetical protein [Planctomycetota bacterium]